MQRTYLCNTAILKFYNKFKSRAQIDAYNINSAFVEFNVFPNSSFQK